MISTNGKGEEKGKEERNRGDGEDLTHGYQKTQHHLSARKNNKKKQKTPPDHGAKGTKKRRRPEAKDAALGRKAVLLGIRKEKDAT